MAVSIHWSHGFGIPHQKPNSQPSSNRRNTSSPYITNSTSEWSEDSQYQSWKLRSLHHVSGFKYFLVLDCAPYCWEYTVVQYEWWTKEVRLDRLRYCQTANVVDEGCITRQRQRQTWIHLVGSPGCLGRQHQSMTRGSRLFIITASHHFDAGSHIWVTILP